MKKLNLLSFSFLAMLAFSSCQQSEATSNEVKQCTDCTAEVYKSKTGEVGVTKKGKAFGRELTYTEIDGMNVYEGDILLREESLNGANTEGTINNATARLWPNRTIVYNTTTATTQAALDKFLAAAKVWTDKAGFKFVRRTNQTNYISLTSTAGCFADISMLGGKQRINLGPDCSIGNAIHEIGHTIGLYHEQSRRDRDDFVNVFFENIEVGKENNFGKCSSCTANGSLDFGSIMMYGPFFFSKNGRATITKKDGTTYNWQRSALSTNDIAIVNSIYR
jgi:hypothetical protein